MMYGECLQHASDDSLIASDDSQGVGSVLVPAMMVQEYDRSATPNHRLRVQPHHLQVRHPIPVLRQVTHRNLVVM